VRVEAFSPLADNLSRQPQALTNDLVVQAIRGKKDELGTDDFEVRCRILACHGFELLPLALGEEDREGAKSRHLHLLSESEDNRSGSQRQRRYVIVITNLPTKPKSSSKNEKKGLYTKEAFTYSAEQNTYRCPAGQVLGFTTQTEQEGGRILRYYNNYSACAACPLRARCTESKQGRRIMRTPEEPRLEAMAQRMEEKPGLMLQRKSVVEHPYGTMKWSWDGGYFLLKGLAKVRGEFSLMTLAYNLRRVMNLLGVECLLEALRTGKMPAPQPV
jgi:hypothetical protein